MITGEHKEKGETTTHTHHDHSKKRQLLLGKERERKKREPRGREREEGEATAEGVRGIPRKVGASRVMFCAFEAKRCANLFLSPTLRTLARSSTSAVVSHPAPLRVHLILLLFFLLLLFVRTYVRARSLD